jgi:DNA-binding CsgD family transcriptional regulator
MEFDPATGALSGRLHGAAAAQLVGRVRERERLSALLVRGSGPAVVFVSGAGGIGKTTLVTAVLADLDQRTLWVDGRHIEPTEPGFLTALAAELNATPFTSVTEAAAALVDADVGVLAVDGFERLNLLDGWLRHELLPALPHTTTTLLIGRRQRNVAWRSSPGWRPLIAELAISELTESDAAALVDRRGLPAAAAERARRFGRGHPLALELAVEALSRHADLDLADGPPADVVEELFEVLLDDLDPADRRTVQTASLLRRITRPLLAAVVQETGQDVESAWRTLREVPFTSTTRIGLELDPLVRNVIAGGMEIREPEFVAGVRRRVAAVALREAAGGRSWEATADLLYLVQNHVIRNSYLPPGGQQHPVERAVTDDRAAILAITDRHDGPEGVAAISRFWASHASGFVVGRGPEGEVTAFSAVTRLSELDIRLTASDPVVAAVLDDVRNRPLSLDAEVLVLRRALGLRLGEAPSPELGSMVVDLKRLYLELRPRLARVYSVNADWGRAGQVMRLMGFGRVGREIRLSSKGFVLCALDFGAGSVDGWLARHVMVESGAGPDEPAGAAPDGTLPLPAGADRPPVARLTAREREVLGALADGLTNRELADRLFISERTANRHLSNIFTKLGVRNRTAAARIAIVAGLTG